MQRSGRILFWAHYPKNLPEEKPRDLSATIFCVPAEVRTRVFLSASKRRCRYYVTCLTTSSPNNDKKSCWIWRQIRWSQCCGTPYGKVSTETDDHIRHGGMGRLAAVMEITLHYYVTSHSPLEWLTDKHNYCNYQREKSQLHSTRMAGLHAIQGDPFKSHNQTH